MGFAALAGFFHYVTAGPNEVAAEEEEEAIEVEKAAKDQPRNGTGSTAGPH